MRISDWSSDVCSSDLAEMRALEELLAPTEVLVISDEVYEHMVYDGALHESAARYPRLAARSFIVSSFGKTYHVTGRSEERRVGKEWVRTCRSRWSPYH